MLQPLQLPFRFLPLLLLLPLVFLDYVQAFHTLDSIIQ
jgi:hypothetical protein